MFRIFLFVLRDGVMASVTWQPRLIRIRLPCEKRLGDVFLVLFLLLKSEGESVGIKPVLGDLL